MKIYRQIVPLNGDQQPGPVLLEPSFRSTLFTNDVGIAELLVGGHAEVDYCRIAVHVYYELSWVRRAVMCS
jgi:hypothetical protein